MLKEHWKSYQNNCSRIFQRNYQTIFPRQFQRNSVMLKHFSMKLRNFRRLKQFPKNFERNAEGVSRSNFRKKCWRSSEGIAKEFFKKISEKHRYFHEKFSKKLLKTPKESFESFQRNYRWHSQRNDTEISKSITK